MDIFSCIYLACVEVIPMRPQDLVRWVKRTNGYYCPCHSGKGSVCEYCVCKK